MTEADTPAPTQAVLAFDDWEQPPRRPSGPVSSPVVAVDGFEGPLDWLLDLARTRRIDLARLSIAALVDAFEEALTAALTTAEKGPMLLARWSDWLVMAAELTLLRSRLLLPVDTADARAARDEAERLRRTLLDRADAASATDWLESRLQVGRDVFLRGGTDDPGTASADRAVDITALLRACLAAIRLPVDAGTLYRLPEPPFWSVLDATTRIRKMLPGLAGEGRAFERFLPEIPADVAERDRRRRVAVSATFLAALELTRDRAATLTQDTAWQSIQISQPAIAEHNPA